MDNKKIDPQTIKLLALDNGVKWRFAICGNKGSEEVQKKWNFFIEECNNLIPGFEDDYIPIDHPFSFLEQIFLGKLIEDLPSDQKAWMAEYFPKPKILFQIQKKFYKTIALANPTDIDKEQEDAIHFLTREILVTFDALKYFFFQVIDRKRLIEECVAWCKKYPCHSYASAVSENLKDWANQLAAGDKEFAFTDLVKQLAWHVLLNHEWLITLEDTTTSEICQFERDILLRIVHLYLKQLEDEGNLSGAQLFARLEKIGTHTQSVPSTKTLKLSPNLFKKDQELLDRCFTEYLVTGYVYEGNRQPLTVISCDKKNQKERLKAMIRGIKYVNTLLEDKEQRGKSPHKSPALIPICPGTLILIDQNCKKPAEKIDIQELID